MRALLIALATLLVPGSPAAQRLAVKARTFVDGLRASSEGGTVVVTGTLRDNLGQPVPHAGLSVGTAEVARPARTDPRGRFRVELTLPGTGLRQIQVAFAGNGLLAPARTQAPVRVGRRGVELRLTAPDSVEADQPVTVAIAATDGRGAAIGDLLVQVRLDAQPLPPARLGASGTGALALPPLSAGTHTVKVHWPGDSHRLPASAELAIAAGRSMAIGLAAVDPNPAPGRPVVLEGQVTVGPGQPVSVRLTANNLPIDAVRTDDAGRFTFTVDADDVRPGAVRFRAAAHSDAEGWRDALSAPVIVQVPPPPPPSPWWIWAPVLLAAASLIGVLGRTWVRRPRPEARPAEPVVAPPPPFTFEAPVGAATGRLVVHLRDGVTGAPLRGTVVWLPASTPTPSAGAIAPPHGLEAATDATGLAELTGQGDRLWAWADGYAPACHALPAAGGRARVGLLPIRARLQTLYAEVLAAAGRPPLRFGRETPREAEPPLTGRGAPADPLAALSRLVEEACFDLRVPDHERLVRALALATAVRSGLEHP